MLALTQPKKRSVERRTHRALDGHRFAYVAEQGEGFHKVLFKMADDTLVLKTSYEW